MSSVYSVGLQFTAKTQQLDAAIGKLGEADRVAKRLQGQNPFTGLTAGSQKLDQAVESLNGRLRDARGRFISTGAAAGQAAAGVSRLQGAISGLVTAAAVMQGARFIFGKTAELETQTRSIQVLTGSLGKAKEIVSQLQQYSNVTPFTSSEVIDTAKRLSAFGVATEKVVDTTKRLGDVAGATGANLGELSLAYGQVMAKGRLQGEELLQFQERGVGLGDELRRMYKLSGEEFSKALEKGQFSSAAVEMALQNLTSTGGKYANGAISQSDTLAGKLSTLQDSIEGLAREIGSALSPALSEALTDITEFVNKFVTGLQWMRQEYRNFLASLRGDNAQELQGQITGIDGMIANNQAQLPRAGGRAAEIIQDKLKELRKLRASLQKDYDKQVGLVAPAGQSTLVPAAAAGGGAPPALLGDDKAKKDKAAKDHERAMEKLAAEERQLQQQLAQNEIALDNQVFKNQMELIRQRYAFEKELADKQRNVWALGFTGAGREQAQLITGLKGSIDGYGDKIVDLKGRIAEAEQQLKSARAGVGIAQMGQTPITAGSGSGGGPASSGAQRVLDAANKNLGLFAGQSERCADAMRALFTQADIGIGVTKKAWDGLASGGSLASSFFGSDIGQKITNIRDLQPGDLVGFERTYGNWGPGVQTHVGVYAGGGQMFDHSSRRGLVKRSMDTFGGKFMYGVRPYAYGGGAAAAGGGGAVAGLTGQDQVAGAQGNVAVAEAELAGLKGQLAEVTTGVEKLKATDLQAFVLQSADAFRTETAALTGQTAALQLRTRLEAEGVQSAFIEAEVKKLEVSQQLAQRLDVLKTAYDKGLISLEAYTQATAALQGAATGTASALDANAVAVEAKRVADEKRQQAASDAQGISSTITGGLKDAIKAAVTGGDVKAALSGMLGSLGDKFLDMAMRPLEEMLTKQLTQMFNPQALATQANTAATVANTAALNAAAVGGAGGFGGAGGILGGLGSLFGGGGGMWGATAGLGSSWGGFAGAMGMPLLLASGGSVDAGGPQIVGERGPELFVPGQSGGITNHQNLRSMMASSGAGGGGANAGPVQMDISYSAVRIDSIDYVNTAQMQEATTMAAKRGAAEGERRALDRLRQSPRTRRSVGL